MTAIDIVVVGGILCMLFFAWRSRPHAASRTAVYAAALIALGLVLVALVYAGDLMGRQLLGWWVDEATRRRWMAQLHFNFSWVALTLAFLMICVGFASLLALQRKIERQSRLRKAQFRSIVEGYTDYLVRWAPNGTLVWANQEFCDFAGARLAELTNRHLATIENGPLDLEHAPRLDRDKTGRARRSYVREWVSPSGNDHHVEWRDTGIFDAGGTLIEIQSVGRDVTDRVRALRALESSESRFRGFVENTADWVWELDAGGYSVYNNKQVESILGYTPAEIGRMHWRDIIHPDDLERGRKLIDDAIANRRGWKRAIFRLRHRDGSYRYLESTAYPSFDAEGAVSGFHGIDRDVTVDTLMSRISASLLGCDSAQLKSRIRAALEEIGLCFGLERITFWWLAGSHGVRLHEWSVVGVESPAATIAYAAAVPEAAEALLSGRILQCDSVDALPADLPDKKFLQSQGTKSYTVIPLFHEERLVGTAVFATITRERHWRDGEGEALRLLADKIAAASAQSRLTQALQRRERDLAQSESLARMGSFAYYPGKPDAVFPAEWCGEFSPEQCDLFGVDAAEASHEQFIGRVVEDDRPRVLGGIRKLLGGSTEVEFSFRIADRDGRVRHIANRTRADRDGDGQIVRIIGANLDVTDRVEREATLGAALDEIRELKNRLEAENDALRETVRSIEAFEEIVGESDRLRAILDLVSRAAPMDVPILITGETGTGKELVARAVHKLSGKKDAPFIRLNCAALPEGLIESELFGHEPGAFTGASSRRKGRFEAANGGTLFLDEIGDLPLGLQGKLLRVLQDGEFERLGSSRTMTANVRLVAATNRDLSLAVARGEFRADLLYRINTVHVDLPPLRERRHDIPLLAQHFVHKHATRLGKTVKYISADTLQKLQRQDWPGNIRELEHFIERALISTRGDVLTTGELTSSQTLRSFAPVEQHVDQGGSELDLKRAERLHIIRVLDEVGWKINGQDGAAARLRVPPSTLRSKMKKLEIAREH